MTLPKYILNLFFLSPVLVCGQTITEKLNMHIEKVVEQTVSSSEGGINVETIISDLEYIYANPLNLNAVNAKELDKLWLLNDFQIKSLLDYRTKMGQIISINELIYIFGFDKETVELISPFVYIGTFVRQEPLNLHRFATALKHEVILRTSQQNTVSENYSGSMQKYYARYKASYKNRMMYGFIAEKDAGEEFFTGSNYSGFDFYSGFIMYNGKKALQTIVLGDYRVRVGQGLLIWPGYSSGKSSQITSVQKRGQGLTGNTSADEYSYFRGGAVTLGSKNISVSMFGSYKQIDANLDSVTGRIRAIRTNGLHRTPAEKACEKNVSERIFGTKINYTSSQFTLGLNWLNTSYSSPLLPSEEIYQYYNFNGQDYNGFSGDYKILLQRFQTYGEAAFSKNSYALINGINIMPHPNFLASLVYRNYQKNYFSPYSNALSEGSSTSNEEGLYAGLQWKINRDISIAGYVDVFSFPWLKYGINGPSSGKEHLLEGVYKPYSHFQVTIRYKHQKKIKNYAENASAKMNSLNYYQQNNIRVHLWYLLSQKLSMSSRYEWSHSGYLEEEPNQGNLVFQDIVFKPKGKIQLNFRYAWFDVENYNSRIYAYESNARFIYSMPAYYGQGTKCYLLFKYKALNWFTLWLRFSSTNYFDEEVPGKQEGLVQVIINL